MTSAPDNLSFLPEDYIPTRKRRRLAKLGVVLLLIVMAGVGGAFVVAERTLLKLKSDHTDVATQCDMAAAKISQFEQLHQRQEELSRRARLAASLVEQMPRSAVVAEVRKRMPAGITLLDINLTSTPISVPSQPGKPASATGSKNAADEPRPVDVRMKITGLAQTDPQVAAFVESLVDSAYFTDASLLISLQTKVQGDYVRRFEIEVRLAAQVPVRKPAGDPAKFSASEDR